jgi:PAS domain S-box-containing protein
MMPVLEFFLSPEKRMALLSAYILSITGIVLILFALENTAASNIALVLFFPAAIASYLVPVSYLLNVTSIHKFLTTPVALNSGIAFCAVSIVVYLIKPGTWFRRVYNRTTPGGIMARRLSPWVIVLPVIIAWLRIYGEDAGFFISEVGVLWVAITYTFCFILLVWFAATSVDIIDLKRHAADEALKKSYEEMEIRVRERTAELLELNKLLDLEIKDRIRAEKQVTDERVRINNLLELMPAYLILLTPDHHVAYSNRYFRERFGESKGKRCFEFLFNRSKPCEVCTTFDVLKDNLPHTWDWKGPDGNDYSIFDYPYTDSDGSPLIMEMGIDVTSLKKAEANLVNLNTELEQRVTDRTSELLLINQQLSASQKMAHLGSWELDLGTDVLTWSDEVYNIFGVNPDKFGASYAAFLEIIHPDDIKKVNEAYQNSIDKGMDTYEIEHRIVKKNTSETRYLHEKCRHIRNGNGEIIRSLGMVHDVTERKMMEMASERNNERLELLSQISSGLLASERPQDLVNSFCTRVMKFLDCQVFFNFVVDESKGKLHLNTCAGIPEAEVQKIEWLDFGTAVCGCVARDGNRIVVENIPESHDPRTVLINSFGIKAYACHPLLS